MDKYTPEEMELLRKRAEMDADARKDIHESWCTAIVWSVFWAGLFTYLVWVDG